MNSEQKRVLSNNLNLLSPDVDCVSVFRNKDENNVYGLIGTRRYLYHEKAWKDVTEDEELNSLFGEINISGGRQNKEIREQIDDERKKNGELEEEVEELKKKLEVKQSENENLNRLLQEALQSMSQDEVGRENLLKKAMLPVHVVLNSNDIKSIDSCEISVDAPDDDSEDSIECTFDSIKEEITALRSPSLEYLSEIRRKYDHLIKKDKKTKKKLIEGLKDSESQIGIEVLVSAGYKALRLRKEFGEEFTKSVTIAPSSLHKSNIEALIDYIRNKQQRGQMT